MTKISKESVEKKVVATISVFAAFFLTGFKLVVGLLTGSLGILSEALHSGLDLIAAVMTLFAVRISDKPADTDHHYGHGKIENFSALIETFLLLLTCIWIIWEAVDRLKTGNTHITISVWSFVVVISSIIIDITRSRALMKTAKKYNSQALEADALHFSTDIFSSLVVLVGLIGALLDYHVADSIAALLVAIIVFFVSLRLGKRSIDALLDRTPTDINQEKVRDIVKEICEVSTVHNIRIRTSGPDVFINLNIHVNPELSIQKAHDISHAVEDHIQNKIPRSYVHVHAEPEHN